MKAVSVFCVLRETAAEKKYLAASLSRPSEQKFKWTINKIGLGPSQLHPHSCGNEVLSREGWTNISIVWP
jgi:hypothetical protein